MWTVFWKEVRTYFYSPIAYVLIGFFILLSSIFLLLINLTPDNPQGADFSGTLSNMGFMLMFIVPILTMRILAEDRKNGTEVLLVTSPVSLSEIVIGKYLATLVVFLVMTLLTLVYPLILSLFGKSPVAVVFGAYVGFIFLGASFIAIGVFASSLTENQVVAAVIAFVSLLIIWIIEPIGTSVGGIASKILNWFSLLSRSNDFSKGILGLGPVIYYLSFIAVFIFLTIRVIEKRRWSQG